MWRKSVERSWVVESEEVRKEEIAGEGKCSSRAMGSGRGEVEKLSREVMRAGEEKTVGRSWVVRVKEVGS